MMVEETATILVVDDEPRNVRILQIQLEARGYTVLTAGDGADALEIIADKPPDLILLDINMPKVDGFEVVKRVRADKKTEFIPIIMITALRDTHENRIKAVEAGADDFIEKPFNSFEVMARIKSLLRIKFYHDRLEQHNERLAAELQMARTVQDILIPQDGSQEIAGFNVASHCSPALEIGGDFFDLWEIDENRLGVLISDVMGHGASAALVTVFIKTVVSEHRDKFSDDPAHLLYILNTRFNNIISSHLYMFATAFCGVFDQKKEQLICANAGHPLPFLQHTPQSDCELITHQHTGNGLGISRESVYENCIYPFNALSRTFLYTDGAYEVKDPHGEQFTVEQLQNTIANCNVKTPEGLIRQVSDTITDFTNGQPNEDDLTIIAIQG